MTKIELLNENGWINVQDYDVPINGKDPVDDIVQDIICAAPEDATIYFPKGKYLFKKGVDVCKRLTLRGDTYIMSNNPTHESLYAGTTHFRVIEKGNLTVLRIKGVNHCIQNICFSSDSYNMETDHDRPTDGNPKIHHQPFYKYENVSAIQCYNAKTGNGHYQNLSFWGFSGTALEMPDHSMANDITVMKCSLGINTGENSIISNSKVWGCRTGMQISTGALINNMRVEEISEVGLNNIGEGSNFITNITVDQCGYCGFLFDKLKYTQISGNISRCGQYYYDVSYDEYQELETKIEMANSYFYGNRMESCSIVMTYDNEDNWEDEKEEDKDQNIKKHYAYVMGAKETENVFLTSSIDEDGMVTLSDGNITLYNGRNTFRFFNGKVCSMNGFALSDKSNGEVMKIKDDCLYINHQGTYIKTYEYKTNDVIWSAVSDLNLFMGNYGGAWEKLNQFMINWQTTSCYKKLPDPSETVARAGRIN